VKVTVLIADDLRFFLEVERSYLQRGGFDVLTAASGAEAVALATAHRPHLILLDLEMPETDGAAACAAMRRVPDLAGTPIIIMSARGDAGTRERCLQAGCTEFVVKPEKPDELLGLVARVLAVKKRGSERVTVVFDVNGREGSQQLVGRAHDLSVTGLLLETPAPLAVGAVLNLEFYLPRTRAQIRVTGEVARVAAGPGGTHRAGIRFTDLSQADQEQILDFASS
jgi:CheY-like chemotaxis protein